MNRHTANRSQYTPFLVSITLWIYCRLIYLHPPAFRRNFGMPIIQVFRQTCVDAYQINKTRGVVALWLPALGDLLSGAAAEYVLAAANILKGTSFMSQYRRFASIIFGAYIAFVLAGIGFSKMSEDVMKSVLPAQYPLFSITYDAVMIGAIISLLAILVGGLPIAFASLRFAIANHRRDIFARFAVPPIALLVIAAYIVFANRFQPEQLIPGAQQTSLHIVGFGFVVVFIAGATASTFAILSAIARSNIDEQMIKRFTLLPGIVAEVAMAGITIANFFWSISMWQNAPTLFWGNDGLLAVNTILSISIQTLTMVIATIVALYAILQMLKTRNATPVIA